MTLTTNLNTGQEFDTHIAYKKNKSVGLKDEHFNRLMLTCAVSLYHLEDLVCCLDQFEHVLLALPADS